MTGPGAVLLVTAIGFAASLTGRLFVGAFGADLFRRQAAEKVWGFIVSELNRALREAGYPVEPGPASHEARRQWLRELDRALGTDPFEAVLREGLTPWHDR